MEQQGSTSCLRSLEADDEKLTAIESTILATLKNHIHLPGQIIDIPRLQDECKESGLNVNEFSHGFVRLLTRRLLEPRGDFTFRLSAEGHRLQDAICCLKEGLNGTTSGNAAFLDGTAHEQ